MLKEQLWALSKNLEINMHIFNFHKHVVSDLNGYHFSTIFSHEAYSNSFISVLNPFSKPTASIVFRHGVNTGR
jgi:hypothetical protein